MLGNVIQVEFVDSLIFVLTSQSGSGELHTFAIDGKYAGKIGDRGRGKGEYLMPFSFCIHNNEIDLIDGAKDVVLTYDIKTREFIEERKLPLPIASMAYLNEDLIVSYGQMNEDYFNYLNADYGIEKSFVGNFRSAENSGYSTGSFNPMCRVRDKLMLYTPFYSTIYEVDRKGITPKYLLKLADYKMPDKEFILKIANNASSFSDLHNSEYISYRDYFETTDAMLVNFFVKGNKYIGYYKKLF